MKDDIKEFFSNTEKVKKLCPSYNGEYANIIVKEKYDMLVNDDVADAICIGWAYVNAKSVPTAFNWE